MKKSLDIKNLKVAKRYAKALIEASGDVVDDVSNDLELVNDSIFKNDSFRMFFSHPVVSLKDKKDTIKETFQNRINNITLNFLETLLDEGRFNIFSTIYDVFNQERNDLKNIKILDVFYAFELNDEQKARLKDKLSAKFNKEVILNYQKDDEILGGLVIKFEDKVIDLSLKTKFDRLKKINL